MAQGVQGGCGSALIVVLRAPLINTPNTFDRSSLRRSMRAFFMRYNATQLGADPMPCRPRALSASTTASPSTRPRSRRVPSRPTRRAPICPPASAGSPRGGTKSLAMRSWMCVALHRVCRRSIGADVATHTDRNASSVPRRWRARNSWAASTIMPRRGCPRARSSSRRSRSASRWTRAGRLYSLTE